MVALVDADSLLYKVGFAIEDKIIWNEQEVEAGLETELDIEIVTDLEACKLSLSKYIDGILHYTGCDSIFLVFTGSGNFRYDNPLGYKANRTDSRKPLGYQEMLDYCLEKYPSKVVTGMEADDYVVWLKTSDPEEYLLCAIDKDVLYQTAGYHYNYGTGEEVEVDHKEAMRFAYYQTLAGDPTDGYSGCPKIGKVKADRILTEVENNCENHKDLERLYWEAVVTTYESKGLTEDDAINTMRLANMHQFDGEKITLWSPNFQ